MAASALVSAETFTKAFVVEALHWAQHDERVGAKALSPEADAPNVLVVEAMRMVARITGTVTVLFVFIVQ